MRGLCHACNVYARAGRKIHQSISIAVDDHYPPSSTATQVHQGLHGPGRVPQGGRHGRLHHLGRQALQGRVRQVRAWIKAPSHPIHAWRNAHPATEKTKPTLPTAPHHQTPTPTAGSSTTSAASSPWPTRAATRTAPSSSSPSRPAATSTTSTPSSAAYADSSASSGAPYPPAPAPCPCPGADADDEGVNPPSPPVPPCAAGPPPPVVAAAAWSWDCSHRCPLLWPPSLRQAEGAVGRPVGRRCLRLQPAGHARR